MVNLPAGTSLEDTEQTSVRRRRHRLRRCPRCAPCRRRPARRRRSTSTAWCGTPICAACRAGRSADQPGAAIRARRGRATPSRSICASGCARLKLPEGATLQVVEVPPGPPVLATLLAEIYGPDADHPPGRGRRGEKAVPSRAVHRRCRRQLWQAAPAASHRARPGRDRAFRRRAERCVRHGEALFGGVRVGTSHRGEERDPIDIVIGLPKSDLAWTAAGVDAGAGQHACRAAASVVELGEVVHATREAGSPVLFRRDGRFADLVTGGTRRRVRGADLRHAGGGQARRRA